MTTTTPRPRVRSHVAPDVAVLAAGAGLVVRRALPADGPGPSQVDGLLRRGRLVGVAHGVYRLPGVPVGHETRWVLRLLAGGSRSALTGEVACHLLGLRRARRDAPPLVLAPHGTTRPAGEGVLRSRRCPPGLLVEVDAASWPVVPLARALADAVRTTDDVAHARALVGEGLSRGLVGRGVLLHEITARRRPAGVSATVVGDLAHGGVWSPPEGSLLDLVRWSTVLPAAETNVLVVDAARGDVVARPDLLLWPSALAAEVDSTAHHASPERWEADLHRSLSAEVRGLLVARVLSEAVTGRGQAVLLVLERHSSRRYAYGPPEGLRREPGAVVPRRGPVPRTRTRARPR